MSFIKTDSWKEYFKKSIGKYIIIICSFASILSDGVPRFISFVVLLTIALAKIIENVIKKLQK